jgi:glycosyltransferase involved in cell wall biosynthesis
MRLAYLSIGRHVHTERWIRYFRDRGHECHLFTVQPGPIDGVQVHDISTAAPLKPLRYWRSLGVLKRKLRELQPDLLHTHFLTGYGYWGDFSGFRPNVLTVWGDDVYVTPHENRLKRHLAGRALVNADAITGDSKDILRDCVKLGADPRRCYEVQWGVDFETFRPGRRSDARARLGIPEDAAVIFSPRSFTQPYYNIDVIIEATAALLPRYPRLHVVFAGYEGDQTPFQAKARAAGLTERTHFLGRIPHEEFADHVAAFDIFVSVPSVDATAVSLLEAMACGRAIVVSSLASAMEWIEDGKNGEVVKPRDVGALSTALTKLIEDDALRARYGEKCVGIVRGRADHATNMDRVERLYAHLVNGAEFPRELTAIAAVP